MLLQISKCDRRLLSIKIPNNITRSPQSIHQLVKWKGEKEDNVKDCIHVCLYLTAGSELQNWLLYYSVPVLKDIFTVQKTGYTLSDILRIFRVYASRIPLAE